MIKLVIYDMEQHREFGHIEWAMRVEMQARFLGMTIHFSSGTNKSWIEFNSEEEAIEFKLKYF